MRTAATATTAITTTIRTAICVEVIPLASLLHTYQILAAWESGRGCKAGVIKRVGSNATVKTAESTKGECPSFVLVEPLRVFRF